MMKILCATSHVKVNLLVADVFLSWWTVYILQDELVLILCDSLQANMVVVVLILIYVCKAIERTYNRLIRDLQRISSMVFLRPVSLQTTV